MNATATNFADPCHKQGTKLLKFHGFAVYGRTVAVCFVGALDLGAAMVKGGFAMAYGAYEADEREARDARRGVWSSSFERPAAWRARHPRTGR
jgi:endonuclease YncB( thermonuclease family)